MSSFVQNLIDILKNIFSNEMVIFVISLMPILELRGGLIASVLLKIPFAKASLICILGNIIPIPLILLFLDKLFNFMEKREHTKKIVIYFKNKAIKNREIIEKYGFWGLLFFVGIPLPGTGAWTGAIIASVLNIDIKRAIIGIFLGIVMAFIIVSILSYGVLGKIIS